MQGKTSFQNGLSSERCQQGVEIGGNMTNVLDLCLTLQALEGA